MGNMRKSEISRTILNIFRPYNGIDILKLPFLEELYENTFVVPYVDVKKIKKKKATKRSHRTTFIFFSYRIYIVYRIR